MKTFCRIAFLCVAAYSASAQTICFLRQIPLDQRVRQATLIVHGTVMRCQGFWDSAHRNIFTRNYVQTDAVLKGGAGLPGEVVVVTEGGFVDGVGMTHTNTLAQAVGDRGYWLLEPSADAGLQQGDGPVLYQPVASSQGFLRSAPDGGVSDVFGAVSPNHQQFVSLLRSYDPAISTESRIPAGVHHQIYPVVNNPSGTVPVIVSVAPLSIIGGIGQVLTINGSGFGASRGSGYVSFAQEGGGYSDPARSGGFKYTDWTDTRITLEMPLAYSGQVKVVTDSGEGVSDSVLKVKANLGYRLPNPLTYFYLNDQNRKGGYTWYMHAEYWNNPAAKKVIEDVFKELRCKTGVNYRLAETPTYKRYDLGDTILTIATDSAGFALPPGVVGRYDQLWYSCILGLDTFYYVKSQDMRIASGENWYYGSGQAPAGKAKFMYVLFHEFGHSLQLGHVNEQGQSMYPTVTLLPSDNWHARDTMTAEEHTAGTFLVNQSRQFTFRACGVLPMLKPGYCDDVYENGSVSVTEPPAYTVLRAYPNPATDAVIVIAEPQLAGESYTLTAEDGRTALSGRIQWPQTVLHLNQCPAGMYLLRIGTGGKVQVKIIKE